MTSSRPEAVLAALAAGILGEAYDPNDFGLCYLCHAEAPFVNPNENPSAPNTAFSLHGFHLVKGSHFVSRFILLLSSCSAFGVLAGAAARCGRDTGR